MSFSDSLAARKRVNRSNPDRSHYNSAMRFRYNQNASLALAIMYALTGVMALQITIPPDYVSLIFPPAGIALAAMLAFGPGVWPGILVGSMAVQVIASLQAGADPLTWTTIMVPMGACLQAFAGVWLTHRLVGRAHALDTPGSIVRFLAIVAPISCFINASLAIPLLVAGGILPIDQIIASWRNWWLGDTLGVIIAAPLTLAFIGQPRDAWRPRRLPLGLTVALASTMTAFVFTEIRSTEALRIESQFIREAENVANRVHARLSSQVEMLYATERFAALSLGFSHDDFRAFVTPILQRHIGTQNFTWNPRVTAADRSGFEATIRFGQHTDFRILDRDESQPSRTRAASEAAEYLPILFVEPLEGNGGIIGLNPLSIPSAASAIELTRRIRSPIASEAFTLTQEQEQQLGVVLYMAVFQEYGQTDRFMGLVSSAFRMDDALRATTLEVAALDLELCLIDTDAALDNRRLSGARGCESNDWISAPLTISKPIDFASRAWEIRIRAQPAFERARQTWTGWGVIAIGLLSTGMMLAFLLVTTGHNRRITRLVDERTAELAATTLTLREEQATLSRAQRIAQMGSWELDPESQALTCSDGLRKLLHLPPDECSPADLLDAIAKPDRARIEQVIAQLSCEPGAIALDCRTRDSDAQVMHFVIEGEWHHNKLSRIRGTVQDVSAARQAEADIQQLAHYDVLTGLPNRSLWMTRARSALQIAQRHEDALAVLFLDLDQFKTVNDSLGHQVGDRLLTTVADRLLSCIREEDVLARLGGDEFVAMLPRLTRPEDAATVARKMLDVLSRPMEIDGHELRVSVSIGIAIHPADGSDVTTLLKHADTAMYSAKDAGRDNFQFFVPEMNQRALERLMLEGGIRRAIAHDEFILHYQPQIDATNGNVVGVEALLRWHHPELGLVMPDRFIPVAEDSGLISPLGDLVLHAACRQQVKWQQQGYDKLLVAINISALQFRKPGFVDSVSKALDDTGANPRCIELEITESALMQPSEALFDDLNRLGQMGLTLALDDFGTGYSSLSYLKRLPISRLKLDRSFVKDLPGDPEDAAIASAALSMARDLGIEVVAEGVETRAQRDYLAARGCRIMQGYLFSRPIPASEFEQRFPVGTSIDA